MENSDNTFKSALKPGLIISAISIGIAIMLWALIEDMDVQKKIGYFSWIILAGLYYFYAKTYRDKNLSGHITYGKAFNFLFFITLVVSFLTTVYSYILYKFLDTSLIGKILTEAEENLYEQNMPSEKIEQALEMSSMWITPGIISISALIGTIIFGTVLSLVMAAFVKNELKTQINQEL
jgi:hypothetical protein